MYRLNRLQRNVLIMADEVVFHAPIMQNIDARMIEQAVIIAEERFIRASLGDEFYEALLTEKNLEITSSNKTAQQAIIDAAFEGKASPKELQVGDIVNALEYMSTDSKNLWKQILWKLTAECVMLVAMSDGFVQFSATGVIHNNPTSNALGDKGPVTPDLRSIKWAMDKKLMDRIDPLIEAMHQWLCKKQSADDSIYPLYTKTCHCDHKGTSYKKKTDIVLGIYPRNRGNYLDLRDPHVHPDCCDDDW